jgi:hypothetical protein
MVRLTAACAEAICEWPGSGHAMEIGHAFEVSRLDELARIATGDSSEAIPRLAALICLSPLDLAIHDAFGKVLGIDTFTSYTAEYLSRDLADLYSDSGMPPDDADRGLFTGRYPADFLVAKPATELLAWHLVGGLDPLEASDLTGQEPDDGHPLLLSDWIRRDGLTCLKIKLRGDDIEIRVEQVAGEGLAQNCGEFIRREGHGHHAAGERHVDAAVRGDDEFAGEFRGGVDNDLEPVARREEIGGVREDGAGPGFSREISRRDCSRRG